MTWRQLIVWVRQLPDESATMRALSEEDPQWTLTNHLLATQLDTLAMANWQRSGDEKAPRPQPISRPGVKPHNTRHHGRTNLSREEVLRILRPEKTGEGDDGD